ncbi:tetratricopeptide repeat protein [Herbidospora mongoliensis]|uniref:tetratricopeptide repeat protein n=1 Tax=Herbidospora mongoliensis TaxID=688067 RepID=UPI00082BB4FC|nr:tetratricopeptide repeat protein [Herbidospora mongoliensis]
MNSPAPAGQDEPDQGPAGSTRMEATASGQGRINQAGHNQFIFNLPPLPAPARQIVEGDIPQRPRAFQQRGDLLARLHGQVDGRGAAVIDAVTGTPGVGKSLLAASYAWACQRAGWPVIAWITAETEDQIVTGLAALARRLEVVVAGEDAFASAVRARDWLAASRQASLLVFDNAAQVESVRRWCPATGAARILITTRNRAFHTLYEAVDVGVFTPGQAVNFLHERTQRTTPGADQVAAELGCLPLAIGQAGAYIHRRRLTYPAYLTLLRDYPLDRYLPDAGDGYPAGTVQATLLSIDQAEQTIPRARALLELLSALSEAGVPRAILYGTTEPDPADTEDIDQLLADLADTSLVSFSDDGTTVLMHRLTSRVLRERATTTAAGGGSRLAEVLDNAIDLLDGFNAHIPDGAATWAARSAVDMLVEQTTSLHILAADLGEPPGSLLSLRASCGSHLRHLADLGRAIPLFQQNLADFEQVLGGDHPDTLASRNKLADAYQAAGNLGRAIPLFQQNLTDAERVLGGDHPDTLTSRGNLASAYREAGDLSRAIPLFQQNLADFEQGLGSDHADTQISRNNLAGAYRAAGDLGPAIRLFQQNLADRERMLGGDHPDTLVSRNNLADAYQAAGDLGRAIRLFQQNLADRERVLSGDHPDTLASRNNLAIAYYAAGDLHQAIRLFQQNLADQERVLGDDHLHILRSRSNLASVYGMAGDLGRAISLFEQLLTDCERILGADHPTSRNVRTNLLAFRQRADLYSD